VAYFRHLNFLKPFFQFFVIVEQNTKMQHLEYRSP
jgi:hypothetical protein